jgi:hypothetical protein
MADSKRPAPGLVKRPVLQVSVLRKIPHFGLVSNRFFCNFFGVGGFCFFGILGVFRYCQLWEEKNRESAANGGFAGEPFSRTLLHSIRYSESSEWWRSVRARLQC